MSESEYAKVGVDIRKKGIEVFKPTIQAMYPTAFCVVKRDPDFPEYALVPHADSAGSKPVQSYLNFRESGDVNSFRGIMQDVVAMNLDDIICVGARPISFVDYVALNKARVPKEDLLRILNSDLTNLTDLLKGYEVLLPFDGGETADLPDQLSTLDVSGFMQGRVELSKVVTGERIQPGNKIIGVRSGGSIRYEKKPNSGIMCNGITLARHCLLSDEYERKYPEIRTGRTTGYYGRFKIEDRVDDLGMTIGEAITSPTRIFAPIAFNLLSRLGPSVTGLIHNTGGGQTKCLHLGRGLRYVKRTAFQPDPIFLLIQKASNEPWRDMFQDYNMGVGFEIVLEKQAVDAALSIVEGFGVEAKVVGEVEKGPARNETLIESDFGKFTYGGP